MTSVYESLMSWSPVVMRLSWMRRWRSSSASSWYSAGSVYSICLKR
jgi:hypothetical protein